MNNKLKHVIMMVILFGAFASMAQPSKVETVRMILEDPDPNATKDLKECKRLIDEAKEHPKTANSPKMWVYRAAVYYEISILKSDDPIYKENPDAIKIAAEAIFKCKESDLKKDWTDQFDIYLPRVGYVLFNAGVFEYTNKNYDAAIECYQNTLKMLAFDTKGEFKVNNINEDLIYQYSYYAAMAKGDNKLTKEFITKLIDRNFGDPKIYSALAKVYLDEKDTINSLKTLATGRERFSSDQDLMNMELDIYLKQGKTDVLLKKLEDAIAADENEIYYFARATTYEKIGKPDLAEKDYQKALELKPEYYDALFNLGVLNVNKAKPDIELLQKAYKKVEQDALYAKIKVNYMNALVYFEKCLVIGVPENNKKEEYDLLDNMQNLYKHTDNLAKESEMKARKEGLK